MWMITTRKGWFRPCSHCLSCAGRVPICRISGVCERAMSAIKLDLISENLIRSREGSVFRHNYLNFVSGTGKELVSSLVNTELKCLFNSSAIKHPCVILIPALSSSGPTLSRTFVVTDKEACDI